MTAVPADPVPAAVDSTAADEIDLLDRLHPLLVSAAFHHDGPVLLTTGGLMTFDN